MGFWCKVAPYTYHRTGEPFCEARNVWNYDVDVRTKVKKPVPIIASPGSTEVVGTTVKGSDRDIIAFDPTIIDDPEEIAALSGGIERLQRVHDTREALRE